MLPGAPVPDGLTIHRYCSDKDTTAPVIIMPVTNAIESLHMRLRKIVKNRGHFPSDEAATKLLFLALRNIEKDWKMPQRTWKLAANQFAIMFGERFTNAIT